MKNDFQRSLPVIRYGVRGIFAIWIDISHEIVQQSLNKCTLKTYNPLLCRSARKSHSKFFMITFYSDNSAAYLYSTIVVNNTIFFRERFFFIVKSEYVQSTRFQYKKPERHAIVTHT